MVRKGFKKDRYLGCTEAQDIVHILVKYLETKERRAASNNVKESMEESTVMSSRSQKGHRSQPALTSPMPFAEVKDQNAG
jgi:hypothetical protein